MRIDWRIASSARRAACLAGTATFVGAINPERVFGIVRVASEGDAPWRRHMARVRRLETGK